MAIAAEIVRLRAVGELDSPATTPWGGARHEEIDPVCGMTVDVATARYRTTHDGRTGVVYFVPPDASTPTKPTPPGLPGDRP